MAGREGTGAQGPKWSVEEREDGKRSSHRS